MNVPSFCYPWHGIVTQEVSGSSMLLGKSDERRIQLNCCMDIAKTAMCGISMRVPFLTRQVGRSLARIYTRGALLTLKVRPTLKVGRMNGVVENRARQNILTIRLVRYAGMSICVRCGSTPIPAGETAYLRYI